MVSVDCVCLSRKSRQNGGLRSNLWDRLPAERVIGVNLMLHKPDGSVTVGAIERQQGQIGNTYYLSDARMEWVMGAFPFAPMTWYAENCAIKSGLIQRNVRSY